MNTLTTLGFDNPAVKLWMRFEAGRHGCKLLCGPYAWDLIKDSRVIRIGRRQFASIGHLSLQFDALFKTLVATKAGSETLLDFSRVHLHKFRASGVTFELAQWPEPDAAIDAYFEWYEPQSGDLVFDLGAGCGVSTYVLSKLAGTVVAFAPDTQMRVLLQRNVERHGLANVRVTRESIGSLSELITLHGQPVFCKVNLDEVSPAFLHHDEQAWLTLPILFAARSQSASVRNRFKEFLEENGFETAVNDSLGVLAARPASHVAK